MIEDGSIKVRCNLSRRKRWDSSEIKTKSEGKWLVFVDSKTNKPINSPRSARPRISPPPPPVQKTHSKDDTIQCSPNSAIENNSTNNIINSWKINNYNRFRPTHRIYGGIPQKSYSARDRAIDEDGLVAFPTDKPLKYFHGADPHKNPFRISSKIINEYRVEKLRKIRRPEIQTPSKPASIRLTLYKRSLKAKESHAPYVLPDDLIDFDANSDGEGN